MPSASGPSPQAAPAPAGTGPAATADDPVLSAERDHLRRSREYLGLMRENVLSLRALGADPVSEEYLKDDLYRRAQALTDLPDTPLFFGRLDYAGLASPGAGQDRPGAADGVAGERFHIGRR